MNRSLLLGLLLAGCTTPLHVDPRSGDDLPDGSDDPTTTAPGAPAASGDRTTITFALATPVQRRSGDAPPGCLDSGEGGALGQASPSAVKVRIRSLVLLGADDTEDHVLLSATDYDDSEVITLSASGKALDVAAIPAGTYDGLEMSMWAVEANLPMQIDGVGGASQSVTLWYSSADGVTARDVTVRVEGEESWIDLETGDVVAVADWESPEAVPDDAEAEAWDTGPAERLRMRDDAGLFGSDPSVMTSGGGEITLYTDSGDGTLVVGEDDAASLDISFQPIDTMTWWEGPVGTDTVEADGIFDPSEDCGLDVRPPGVSVLGWTEGADTGE